METRFVLPVTIAMALHALVMLVPREPAPPERGRVRADPVVPFVLPPDKPDAVEVAVADPKPTKGSPDVQRPQADDPPARVIPPGTFVQKAVAVTKFKLDPGKVMPGIPGAPDGGENGWSNEPVIDRSMLDNEPRTRSQASPLYPAELKRLGITGEVVVEFVVDESGRVMNPHVVSSTDRGFEEATLRAVARWRFEPGRKDGRPVRFRMAVPVEFQLGE